MLNSLEMNGLDMPQYDGHAVSSPVGSVQPCAQKVWLSPRCVAKQRPLDRHASCLLSSQHAECDPAPDPVAALLQADSELFCPLTP